MIHTDITRVFPSRLACVAAIGLLVAAAGCGVERPETVPVSGCITFEGNAPPAAGILYFTTDEPAEGFPRRPTLAKFDEQGYFQVTTWDRGDGLMPGRYRITVECWETPPELGISGGESYVPTKYQDPRSTDLNVDIAPDDRARTLELNVTR